MARLWHWELLLHDSELAAVLHGGVTLERVDMTARSNGIALRHWNRRFFSNTFASEEIDEKSVRVGQR